jgi:hypothetical protein
MFVGEASKLTIDGVTITSGERSVTYSNPLILGWSSGGDVEIKATAIGDIALNRVSLLFDYYSTMFTVTNVTFR